MFALLTAPLLLATPQDLPELVVRADDTRVERSCRLVVPEGLVVQDVNGDGVLHVVADGVRIEFAPGSVLRGAADTTDPDRLTGCGIRVDGRRGVTIAGARVRGFKAAIHASAAPGLVVEDTDLSDNFRQRLGSTPEAEDGADWLRPHANDANEWLLNYGAGLWVEDSDDVTVRRVRARRVQNGVVLDRVNDSSVYDCDLSFLSGWGLALWRSSGNVISRNALDFCVRGYSHGVYNRGQDSAGLLMFEQCSRNVLAENSVTHGGDGVFAFAGQEALGEAHPQAPGEGALPEGFDHARKGNNANLFIDNDLSYAAAHGLELTFSFDNRILNNRFVENAICGIWGGYSQNTLIARNEFRGNGPAGYGAERGGINIEHGRGNLVFENRFMQNRCGVRFWWDPDEHLAQLPWARANGVASGGNRIQDNRFEGDEVAIELLQSQANVVVGNRFEGCGTDLVDEPPSVVALEDPPVVKFPKREWEPPGTTRPVGARAELAGREHIVMTEWGPWDHASPIAFRGDGNAWTLRGFEGRPEVRILAGTVAAELVMGAEADVPRPTALHVTTEEPGLVPFTLELEGGGLERPLTLSGVLHEYEWNVTWFRSPVDPREDVDAWREAASGADAASATVAGLDFGYGGGGPQALAPLADGFGTIARARVALPAGRWRVVTTSDDGVRVTADGELVIENWTWHGPTRDEGLIEVAQARTVELLVEHFELDGWAVLTLEIERAD